MSLGVDCGDVQVRDFRRALRSDASDVGAGVLVDEGRDGHRWCHKRINIGHSARRIFSGSVTTSLVVSSRLSSRLSVCLPPVRFAPGPCSFPSHPIPPPPAHSAFVGDEFGERVLSFGAGASVAQSCSFVPFGSVGSSFSSLGSLHSAGPSSLSSRGVAPTRRSVRFHQGKCGNVSAQRGRIIAVASVSEPGVAPTHQSNKVVLNRQVTAVDLGLVSSNVAIHNGSVVGSVSGRQPQQLPSSLHCVLQLRGGASSSSSSDEVRRPLLVMMVVWIAILVTMSMKQLVAVSVTVEEL